MRVKGGVGALDTARRLRRNSTEAERVLWRHLRNRQLGGCKFRRQQPLGSYVVDFACFEKRLIVEVDGGHHDEQASQDAKRDDWLRSRGYRVLRFWNNQILGDVDSVKQAILDATAAPSP